jgi:hypothetical protein
MLVTRPILLLALACAALARPAASVAQTPTARVVVDVDRVIAATNPDLLGVGWNTGDLSRIAPLAPPIVRVDARLESAAPAPGVFALDAVQRRAERARAVGGEPLVILFGMPRWLGEPRAAQCAPIPFFAPDGCDPIFVAPSDLAAWEDVVATVVRALATAEAPAYRFEVWNEPDIPVFWHDTREAFFETVAASHRAVQSVAAETGLPLEVGGPGASGSAFVADYVAEIAARGLPLHFVSWHWYANYPLLGPDGAEGNLDPALYEALKGVNPNATPASYGEQVRQVRADIGRLLAGTGQHPEMLIDEWNLSAGGLDRRHDSNEGAAFVAGSLIEMERAGLDGAAYYRSIGDREGGDWGLVAPDGTKKPAWWVFRAFESASGSLLHVTGDDPSGGFWARASRRGGRVDVLLATFRAVGGTGRRVTVALDGDCAARTASVARIDARSPSWRQGESAPVVNGALDVEIAAQSVAWVQLTCPGGASAAATQKRLPTARVHRR